MSYLFSDEGLLTDHHRDGDDRVFVLQGLRQCLQAQVVADALRQAPGPFQTPSRIGMFRVLLTIDEPQLRDIAATVYSEVGTAHNATEAEGIARVIRNRMIHVGSHPGDPGLFQRVGGRTMFGRNSGNYAAANAIAIGNWTGNMLSDLQATVRSLVSARDVSNGSYFWESTAGLRNAQHPWRRQQWVGGNDPHYGGTALAGAFTPVFIWRADLGQTSFFAYNPNGSHRNRVWP
jgi:hypothetical protein